MTTWATITGPGRDGSGFSHPIVDSDFEWLVKMCYHEIGNADPSHAFEWGAMLWTVANRWASKYGQPGETLGQYAQRFSEPINAGQIGVVHPSGQDAPTADDPTGLRSATARWARIAANRARPISCYVTGGSGCGAVQPSPALVDYVRQFMLGRVWDPRYLALTDWAARGYGHQVDDVPIGLPTADQFYRETWTADWQPGTVMVGNAGVGGWSVSPRTAGLSLAAGIVIAVVGIGWWRRRRGSTRRGRWL